MVAVSFGNMGLAGNAGGGNWEPVWVRVRLWDAGKE